MAAIGEDLAHNIVVWMGIESPLRRRREVRGSCVTCGGVGEAITEEPDARKMGRALRVVRAWVA
jgi:hypothetical protein